MAERPLHGGGRARRAGGYPTTLVWIDADRAVIGRIDEPGNDPTTETILSDVPVHHRSTGHIRHDPTRHGGEGVGGDLLERTREEHLRRFIGVVAGRVGDEPLEILGPGTCREHLTRRLRERDVEGAITRPIRTEPSAPLTQRQFLARLRVRAGLATPRRHAGDAASSEVTG